MPPLDDHPDLLLAVGSGNPHKLEEIAAALGEVSSRHGQHLRVVGKQALPPGPQPLENGATFADNARIKGMAYAELASQLPARTRPRWVLADDSGLAVSALGGAPGVRSARYAGDDATDEDNNALLLRHLDGVPDEKRSAEFVCSLCLVAVPSRAGEPPQVLATAEARCQGEILAERRGNGGFGYDPLFRVASLEKTFAELSTAEKNQLSHRGKALRELSGKIERLIKNLVEIP